MGENTLLDKLIVMDDVSGFDGKFENFEKFLTESRKYGVTCVSIFHTIYPTRNNWQKILSKTKIFNIFPGSIQGSSVVKILSSYYGRYTHEYIPHRDLLFNKLYFNKSRSNKKQCLTIDTRNVNGLGPARFRTGADNNKEQACYYNRDKKDKTFNCFLALRKQTSTANKIIFSTVNLIDSSNKKEDIYFKINNELRDSTMPPFNMNQEIEELVTATLTEKLLISNSDNNNGNNNNKSEHKNMTDESAKKPNFFQDNKSIKKPERKYTIACIESRNFLSNISYVGINKKDFYHENFKFDIYLLMTKNLNRFLFDRKLNNLNKHEMIYMIWTEFMPVAFYKYIYQEENFIYLN